MNVKTEKKVKSLALRREAAVLFDFDAPLYPPVRNTLTLELPENKSLLSLTLCSFEKNYKNTAAKKEDHIR